MKNKLTLIAVLLSSVFAAGTASAYGPEGPFNNSSEVVSAWNGFYPAWGAYVYVDNQLVLDRAGFGPAASASYVSCGDGKIYKDSCPTNQPTPLCLCEHLGSQWDGICEVYGTPTQFSGSESFSWTTFGQASLTSYAPYNPFAVYTVPTWGTGGLNVTVHFPGGQTKTTACAFGT